MPDLNRTQTAVAVYLIDGLTGLPLGASAFGGGSSTTDLDTQGNVVPTYKAHTYTYDPSNKLITDTVTDGASTWVRTYAWAGDLQTSDSGWVKQ